MSKYHNAYYDHFIKIFSREIEDKNKKAMAFFDKNTNTFRRWLRAPNLLAGGGKENTLRNRRMALVKLTDLNTPTM